MSGFESWHDKRTRSYRVQGDVTHKDLMFHPNEIAERVRHEIVGRIADAVMERLQPHLDVAMKSAFREFNIEEVGHDGR